MNINNSFGGERQEGKEVSKVMEGLKEREVFYLTQSINKFAKKYKMELSPIPTEVINNLRKEEKLHLYWNYLVSLIPVGKIDFNLLSDLSEILNSYSYLFSNKDLIYSYGTLNQLI